MLDSRTHDMGFQNSRYGVPKNSKTLLITKGFTGSITSFEFMAITATVEPTNYFCINSTANTPEDGVWICNAGDDSLHNGLVTGYGGNDNGFTGVTFSPEPGTFSMIGIAAALCTCRAAMRKGRACTTITSRAEMLRDPALARSPCLTGAGQGGPFGQPVKILFDAPSVNAGISWSRLS